MDLINMNNIISEEEIETAEDISCNPENFEEAVIWGTDWTTETIFTQLQKGNIDLNPSFQRRDAWTDREKSKLIESLILGLPVPPIILAENKNKKNSYIVIDGKQRLLSIRRFFEENDNGEFAPLKIKSLDILTDLNGCTYKKAKVKFPEYIRSIENQTIRTIIIKNWPDEPFLYTVFLRLNTGSKKLSPQELRQALKPGEFLDFLDASTAVSSPVLKMLGNKTADSRMRDIELTLRFYAFYYFIEKYSGNLKDFLDMTCEELNKNWESNKEEFSLLFKRFEESIEFSFKIMNSDSPFGRYEDGKCISRFNRAFFELFTYYFIHDEIKNVVRKDSEQFIQLFMEMNEDVDFVNSISGSTKDIHNLALRFEKFYQLLSSLSSAQESHLSIPHLILDDGKIHVINALS